MSKNDRTSKATVTTIKASSRASVKVGDSYYTVEYTEERTVPNTSNVDIQVEKDLLWDTVNGECDKQIEDILKTFKK